MDASVAPHALSVMMDAATGIDVAEQRVAADLTLIRAAQLALLTTRLPVRVWTADRSLRLTSSHGDLPWCDAEAKARIGHSVQALSAPPTRPSRRSLPTGAPSEAIRLAARSW